jgi:hypothetical protein
MAMQGGEFSLAHRLVAMVEERAAQELIDLRKRIHQARRYMNEVSYPNKITLSHIGRYLDGTQTDPGYEPSEQPEVKGDAALVLGMFERRWRCEVNSSGYYNGDGCTPGDPHGGWRCEYRWIAPSLTDQEMSELRIKITHDQEAQA